MITQYFRYMDDTDCWYFPPSMASFPVSYLKKVDDEILVYMVEKMTGRFFPIEEVLILKSSPKKGEKNEQV